MQGKSSKPANQKLMYLPRQPSSSHMSQKSEHEIDNAHDGGKQVISDACPGFIEIKQRERKEKQISMFFKAAHDAIVDLRNNDMQENSITNQNAGYRAACASTAEASANRLSLATQRSKQYVIKNMSDAIRKTESKVKAVSMRLILAKSLKILVTQEPVDTFVPNLPCSYAQQPITSWLTPSTMWRTECSELSPAR